MRGHRLRLPACGAAFPGVRPDSRAPLGWFDTRMDACNNMHPGAGPGVSLWQASRAQPLMEQPSVLLPVYWSSYPSESRRYEGE